MPGVTSIMPGKVESLQLHHQRMDPEAQFEIEHDRAVFDEQMAVALPPVGRGRPIPVRRR